VRTGIFGGTFNPVHCGHLICARFILEQCFLDRIIFIPSKRPVHKHIEEDVSPEERYHMMECAIEGEQDFFASRIEIDRATDSYTIFTVNEMKAMYPDDDFFLLVGADSYNELQTWREYTTLLRMVTLVVMRRPGDELANSHISLKEASVIFAENPRIDISSSMIRERVVRGLSIRNMVPPAVEEYICAKGLYRSWTKK